MAGVATTLQREGDRKAGRIGPSPAHVADVHWAWVEENRGLSSAMVRARATRGISSRDSRARASAPAQLAGFDDEFAGCGVASGLEQAVWSERGDDAARTVMNVGAATAGAYDGLGAHAVTVGRRCQVL